MKTLFVLFFAALVFVPALASSAEKNDHTPPPVEALWKASGGENWPSVKTIDFTFSVVKGGKTIASAEHHWDVSAWTDHVKWKDKDVTVNLANPASDEDSTAAYARWVNDSFWLLAPLKLKDRGVQVKDEGRKTIDGAEREVLHLSFDKVGLTPNDQYRLYLDPDTHLVSSWDYMPEPGKTMHASWTDYQRSGGLTLATNHFMDSGVQIRFLNLEVRTK
ncbi:MAG TPA: hypothetical protein VGI60_02085 [Chthoniobacterales bacterium]|jgi:hypothetical protein